MKKKSESNENNPSLKSSLKGLKGFSQSFHLEPERLKSK
jgi:hypothetical protein